MRLEEFISNSGPNLRGDYSRARADFTLDQDRILRTDYRIDSFQDTYFVIESFERLVADTALDLAPVYERVRALVPIAPDEATPSDVLVS